MRLPIYLDYAASTPLDARVATTMVECLTNPAWFGNPHSSHCYGVKAKQAIEEARVAVASLIEADPDELIWTSGATESINLALYGAALLYRRRGKHIITVATEHKAVLECCQQLVQQGFQLTVLPVNADGLLNLTDLENALRDDTILVSLAHVNHELGVCHDIAAVAELTASHGILLHVDAAQSVGKVPIDLKHWPIDLVSLSSHKLYGPKGVGALYLRKRPRVRVAPMIYGGGQERGLRAGTLATHQIIGMGKAFQLAKAEMYKDQLSVTALRDQLWHGLAHLPGVRRNSHPVAAIPHILNLSFPPCKSQTIIEALQADLAISAGSACLGKGVEPSYVLRAIGVSPMIQQSAIRFSLGRMTTPAEIDSAIEIIRRFYLTNQWM